MEEKNIGLIKDLLGLKEYQVKNTMALLEEGASIPFIARYRKERTGNLDEVEILNIKNEVKKLEELASRKTAILKSIEEQGLLTTALKDEILKATNLSILEDIYLPFKPKRKTKGSMAKELGLEPLAKIIMKQEVRDPHQIAEKYISDKVEDVEKAIAGARDIMAEWINETSIARSRIRSLFEKAALINAKVAKGKEEEGEKYKDYFSYSELLSKCPSHRLLAVKRGENEGFLKVSVRPDEDRALETLNRIFVKGTGAVSAIVQDAVTDAYKRLLAPSIETEIVKQAKEKADNDAILVFSENLKQLLMAPPLGPKRILAIDPGFKSGCKVVCLDNQGNLLHNETIFPHPPQKDQTNAIKKINSLVDAYKIEAIAIGNGTAGRETEFFIRKIHFKKEVAVYVVNENGASIYSASKIARDEFPQYDVTVRGSVSIGRRLIDPLAELVKIDPKSIGVGQYQHDVEQNKLKENLDQVVENCVNSVGVNLNTASNHLLAYVAGIGPKLAQKIVDYRKENGIFESRKALLKVPGLGQKIWEQCSGFLRIPESKNVLDNTAVHPERYELVLKMAKDQKCTLPELISDGEKRKKITIEQYQTEDIGAYTLKDILKELEKPGRDPRSTIKLFEFDKNVRSINDLHEGMELPGIVSNITNFGAFIDIGLKESGLVHKSEMANEYVTDPTQYVKLHQTLKVKVVSVDLQRKRIQLTLKGL